MDLYHGTSKESAADILKRGFNLDNHTWGRGWGQGVYLSLDAEFASIWGSVIIRCQLLPNTRILWHDNHDPKVIDYLKKEFKKDITRPDFWKVLPVNKQLTKNELVNLWRYLVHRYYQHPRRFKKEGYQVLVRNYSRIYKQLRLHQFHGVGNRDVQWPEVLLFNPSRVNAVSAHKWRTNQGKLSSQLRFS